MNVRCSRCKCPIIGTFTFVFVARTESSYDVTIHSQYLMMTTLYHPPLLTRFRWNIYIYILVSRFSRPTTDPRRTLGFRHAPGRTGNIQKHPAQQASHDVQRYIVQGDTSCLQKVHARCNYTIFLFTTIYNRSYHCYFVGPVFVSRTRLSLHYYKYLFRRIRGLGDLTTRHFEGREPREFGKTFEYLSQRPQLLSLPSAQHLNANLSLSPPSIQLLCFRTCVICDRTHGGGEKGVIV